jgi:cellobiose transport system substrate-binding protein
MGIAPDGKMIAFPMDTGPTALFYRSDIFAQAGLPTDPQQVSAMLKTWDDYLQAGQKVKTATNGKSFMIDNINTVFGQMLSQSPQQYFNKSGKYIADQSYMKQMWDTAVKAHQMDISAKIPLWTSEWNQAANNGLIASFVGAVWMKQILEDAAPDTAGKWRIALAPGGSGSSGGSFLAISKSSPHPKEAFEVMKWLLSPQNQLISYNDLQLYPSTPSTLDNPDMHKPEPFFGNQDTTAIFATAMKEVPIFNMSSEDNAAGTGFNDQLPLVEFQNKNSDQAWNDAQAETRRLLTLQ